MAFGMLAWTPSGPRPRFTISFLSMGQRRCVKMPTGQFCPQAPQVVHSYTARVKSSSSLRSAPPGPKSSAFRPWLLRMNSRNMRIFSGGEILALPDTSWMGQCLRHSPHWVQASSSRIWPGVSSSVKGRLFFMHHHPERRLPFPRLHHHERRREDVRREKEDEDEDQAEVQSEQQALRQGGRFEAQDAEGEQFHVHEVRLEPRVH